MTRLGALVRLAWLVLLAVVVSGCTVEPPTLEQGPSPTGLGPGAPPVGNVTGPAPGANLTIDAPPTWVVGQWWRMRTGNGEETRVVTADGGGAYTMETSDPGVAYFDALSDISLLGPIRASDLAGSQRGSFVEMYRFPLAANNTWTTTWDGVPRTITVLGPTIATLAGRSYGAMALEAREGERVAVRYNFVPELGWFSFMEFLSPEGSFRMDLLTSGVGYNGTLAKAAVQVLYQDGPGSTLKPQGSFSAPAGLTFLDFFVHAEGDSVNYALTAIAPNNTAYGPAGLGPCSANCSLTFQIQLPSAPGTWNLASVGASQGGTRPAVAEYTVRGAAISLREYQ
jgi:hypothetical protein